MISTEISSESGSTRNMDTEKINFDNPFTKHPAEVGMTYIEHALFALSLARNTVLMTMASLIHAFFPFLFVTFTSRKIEQLHELLKKRNSNNSK